MTDSGIRTFRVEREGIGRIAVGALMPTHSVALAWILGVPSKVWFDRLEQLIEVHLHPGTVLIFDDNPDRPVKGPSG